jgi:hypothetical protein
MRIPIRTSRWAIWASRAARLTLPVLIFTIYLHRQELIDSAAFKVAGGLGLVLGLVALVLGLIAYGRIWITGDRGWRPATWGVIAGLICVAPLAYGVAQMLRYPDLSDISTDIVAPPPISQAIATTDFSDPQISGAIIAAFPNAASRDYPLPAQEAFLVAQALAEKRGWSITAASLPLADSPGLIRAVDTTLLGWRDEIAIRVTPSGEGARVDMRSASRESGHDLGANGMRIEAFLLELDDRVTDRTHQLGLVAPDN